MKWALRGLVAWMCAADGGPMEPVMLVVFWVIVSFVVIAACLGLAIIASDTDRYLRKVDFGAWRDRQYLGMLPNFLQAAHEVGIREPWPSQVTTLHVTLFRWRCRGVLKAHPKLRRRQFLREHMHLRAMLEALEPFIQDAVLAEEARLAGRWIAQMHDSAERDRLLAFAIEARKARQVFAAGLSAKGKQLQDAMAERHFLQTLRMVHAIFREHGFVLLSVLDDLRRRDDMTGAELAHDLPVPVAPQSGRVWVEMAPSDADRG